MNKFNQILKNVLIFLIIFLVINYVMNTFFGKKEEIPAAEKGILVETVNDSFKRTKVVTLEIQNNTDQKITLKNECPGEPFNVLHYENNEWVKKTATPALNCENSTDISIEAGEKTLISYNNWNHALFYGMGRFRIEIPVEISGLEKPISSNEFEIKEEGVFSKLWWGIFYRPIYNGLIYLTKVLPAHDLGLAIIILTLIIRTILLAPSHKAMISQRKMQEIQPRLEKIKEKYKGDQQRISMETMAAWKEAKVNPLGSCLPILLQFPFLIAVFYVVKDGLNPDHAFMLYSKFENFSASDINVNFLGILNLTKPNLYVLPVIVGGLQFFQLKLSMHKKAQKGSAPKNEMAIANNMMTYFMPVMIAVFTASLPSGVGLYWGTSTLYGLIQQIFVNKQKVKKSDDEPTVKVITQN